MIRERVYKKYGLLAKTRRSKEIKLKMKREMERRMQLKLRAKTIYELKKIWFENNRVKLRLRGFCGFNRMSFRPSQLIRHFSHGEIRKAAKKFMLLKIKYNL